MASVQGGEPSEVLKASEGRSRRRKWSIMSNVVDRLSLVRTENWFG